jgi:hypothetical protein
VLHGSAVTRRRYIAVHRHSVGVPASPVFLQDPVLGRHDQGGAAQNGKAPSGTFAALRRRAAGQRADATLASATPLAARSGVVDVVDSAPARPTRRVIRIYGMRP